MTTFWKALPLGTPMHAPSTWNRGGGDVLRQHEATRTGARLTMCGRPYQPECVTEKLEEVTCHVCKRLIIIDAAERLGA